MSDLKPVYDRSRVVQDWKCPRSRYWQYDYDGTGIVQGSTSLELFMGITLHDALAAIARLTQEGQSINIDEIASAAQAQMYSNLCSTDDPQEVVDFAEEQSALVEGLIRGFYKHVWTRLLATYPKIVFVEQEIEYSHDDLVFMCKPDLVLANEEETVYIEYKSTSSKKDNWVNSWATAVQLHSTVAAIAAATGISVDAVVVQGLYKGYESYGKQNSPLCYAYRRAGTPPFSQDQYFYEYAYGTKKYPAWKLPGGIKKWIDDMPETVLADQFPATAPIYIKPDLVERFFAQRAIREHEIVNAMSYIRRDDAETDGIQARLDDIFPQRFDQCIPYFGRECQYKRLCHGPKINPLASGYVRRDPHHDPEIIYLKKREELKNVSN